MSDHTLISIEPYIIKECLAQRPERSIYSAYHQQTKEQVILKVLNPALMPGWKDLELFEREGHILKNLNHPGIPKYLDAFQYKTANETLQVLVENYIPGKNLAELLNTHQALTEPELKTIALGLLNILVYLNHHHPPLIHRDIKPSNILWGEDKKVYLLDFGAVSELRKNKGGSTVVGTFGYMSPEQTMGRSIPASDRYSLGATLLHLVSQTPPEQWPHHGFELLWNFKHGIKEPWLSLIQGLTKVNPHQRISLEEAIKHIHHPHQLTGWKFSDVYTQKLIIREKADSVSIYMPKKSRKPDLFSGPPVLIVLLLVSAQTTSVWWLWWLFAGNLIWYFLLYQPRLYLGPKWFFQSGKRPRKIQNIENIQIVHNPYRQGLRLEYRNNSELKHIFMPLNLSKEELEQSHVYLNRYYRKYRKLQ